MPTDPFDPLFFGGPRSRQLRLDFIQKDSSREKTVEGLGALLLTLNPNARGPMVKHHTGGRLVDLLATCAGGPDKLLLQVSLPDSQGTHAADQLFFFFERNHKQPHSPSFVAQRPHLEQGGCGLTFMVCPSYCTWKLFFKEEDKPLQPKGEGTREK